MPRIVLVTQYYYPYSKSNAKLMYDLARELHRQGIEVLVVTPDEHLAQAKRLDVEEGVEVLRFRSQSFQSSSTFRRALAEIAMVFNTWRIGHKQFKADHADLIVWWAPSIFYTILVSRLKKLWKVPAYLILRDFVPKWWVDCGILKKNSLLYWVFRGLEIWQYKVASVVAVQSPANFRYFDTENLPWVKTELLWNWASASGQPVVNLGTRAALNLVNKVVFFYGGNLGKAQGVDNIIRLAESLRDDDTVHFLLVGDGSEFLRIKDLLNKQDLKNLTLLPAVDQETYMNMLSEYDVGVIALDVNHSTQNFPGKMLNYMYFGKPCLACINPGNDLKELLETQEAGLVSLAGDNASLVANARRLASDAELRARLGANGRKTLHSVFSAEAAAKQLIAHIPSASQQRRR